MTTDRTFDLGRFNLLKAPADNTSINNAEIRRVELPDGQFVRDVRMDAALGARYEDALNHDMTVMVLAGGLRVGLNGQLWGSLQPGEVIAVPAGVLFSFRAEQQQTVRGQLAEVSHTPFGTLPGVTHLVEFHGLPRPRA